MDRINFNMMFPYFFSFFLFLWFFFFQIINNDPDQLSLPTDNNQKSLLYDTFGY